MSSQPPPRTYGRLATVILVVAALIATTIITVSASSGTATKTVTETSTTSATTNQTGRSTIVTTTTSSNGTQSTCTLPEPTGPGPFFLRVVSDSNQTPIVGAQVTANSQTTTTGCNGSQTSAQTTLTFTTNNTEWYSLDTANRAGYSIVVTYSGHTYNLTSGFAVGPIFVTCASLYLPSGETNVTMGAPQGVGCPLK
jgi:hypothetical protein